MALKQKKPTSPSRRFTNVLTYDELTKHQPERSLVERLRSKAGRNSAGRVSVRHRGGGHKRKYRIVDFRREKRGIPATVAAIEYDPNRSANLALLHYRDGEKRYIVAPLGLAVGMSVVAADDAEPTTGNALPLGRVPVGVPIHNLELIPGAGAQLVRAAGGAAQLMSREGDFAHVRMPSGEVRLLNVRCFVTVGQIGNVEHDSVSLGKAGRRRWLGIRPTVRGVAMNPVDHPMGGGEGRTSGGGHPVSPWGKLAKAGKTRGRRKPSGKFIIKRRK